MTIKILGKEDIEIKGDVTVQVTFKSGTTMMYQGGEYLILDPESVRDVFITTTK